MLDNGYRVKNLKLGLVNSGVIECLLSKSLPVDLSFGSVT